MYGVEAEGRGLGGLAAQAPGGNRYFGASMRMAHDPAVPIIGGAGPAGVLGFPGSIATLTAKPQVSGGGDSVEHPVHEMHPHWSTVLDFHNSPAPYILIGLLALYAWVHVSIRASGSARVGR